jgi:heme A synthase
MLPLLSHKTSVLLPHYAMQIQQAEKHCQEPCSHKQVYVCTKLISACLQGFVGWWMVRSGLREADNEHYVPRVSPYRLAAHLTSAFAIYSALVWTTLTLWFPKSAMMLATQAEAVGGHVLRRRLLPLCMLIGVTAVSGARNAWISSSVGWTGSTLPGYSKLDIALWSLAQPSVLFSLRTREPAIVQMLSACRGFCRGARCWARLQHLPPHERSAHT